MVGTVMCFTLWTAADSDGDGVMEYTEYFSATLTTGAGGNIHSWT